jgi:hypothetical protein
MSILSPSPHPSSAADRAELGLGAGVSLPASSQDSEKTISMVGTQEAATLVDPPSIDQVESALVEPIVTVAQLLVSSEVGVLVVHETPLVVASASSPYPSLGAGASHFVDDRRLIEEVLKEFGPVHRLSKLSASWTSFMAGATSFGDMLQVSILPCLPSFCLGVFFLLLLLFFFHLGLFSRSVDLLWF